MVFRIKETGSGALNVETEPSGAGLLDSVRITLDAASATAENLIVKIDSASGAQYDITLAAQDMNTLSYYAFQPTRPHQFFAGDKIDITWTNSNTRTWGLEVMWS